MESEDRLHKGRIMWSAAALLAACTALVTALSRVTQEHTRSDDPWILALGVTAASIAGGVLFARRGGRLTSLILAILLAALAASGMADLPEFVSAHSFGNSPKSGIVVVVLVVATLSVARAKSHAAEYGDDALLMIAAASSFGGLLFVRQGDEFFALFPLLAITAVAIAPDRVHRVPFGGLAFTFIAACLPALFVADDLERHAAGLVRVVCVFAPLWLLARGEPDLKRIWRLAVVVALTLLAGAAVAAFAISDTAGYVGLPLALSTRLPWFGIHPNLAAPYVAVAAPLVLAICGRSASRTSRSANFLGWALAISSVVPAACALYLTRSRVATVAFAVGIATLVALFVIERAANSEQSRRRGCLAAGALGLVIGVLAAFAARGAIATQGAIESNSSFQFRRYMWETSARTIAESPVFGHGFLDTDAIVANALPSDLDGRPKDTHPHDVLLSLAVGAGIPAACVFAALVVALFWSLLRAFVRSDDGRRRAIAAGALASLAALTVADAFDQGLAVDSPVPLNLGLLLGIAALLENHKKAAPATAALSAAIVPSARRGSLRPLLLALPLLLVWPIALRVGGAADVALRRGDFTRTIDLARLASQLLPTAEKQGLRNVAALSGVMLHEVPAYAAAAALARRHHRSASAYQTLATRTLAIGDLDASLAAIQRARVLDRTGPRAGEFALFEAEIQRHRGVADGVASALADALTYDPYAAKKMPFEIGPDGKARMRVADKEATRFVVLDDLVDRNMESAARRAASEPWAARRIVMSSVALLVMMGRRDAALAKIDDFERAAGDSRLHLDALKERITLTDVTDVPVKNARTMVARAERLVDAGDLEGGLDAYMKAQDALSDVVAQLGELTRIGENGTQIAIRANDVGAIERFLPLMAFTMVSGVPLVAARCELAQRLREGGDLAGARRELLLSLPDLPRVDPGDPAAVVLSGLAAALVDLDREIGGAEGVAVTTRMLNENGDWPACLLVAALYHNAADPQNGKARIDAVRNAGPFWDRLVSKLPP